MGKERTESSDKAQPRKNFTPDGKEIIQILAQLEELEADALTKLTSFIDKKGALFVDVGTADGGSAFVIATQAKVVGGVCITIDPYWENRESRNNFLDLMADSWEVRGHLFSMIMPSQLASQFFPNKSIDFLFIDGDHRYSEVKADLTVWLPKMKPDSLLCGHDCERKYSDMTEEEQRGIDAALERDDFGGFHSGVIRALYDVLGDNYETAAETRVWFTRIFWEDEILNQPDK